MNTATPTKIQLAYAYIMTNPGCSTRDVARYISRPVTLVGSWLHRAERKGQVRIVSQGAGRRPNTWAVTNRPVKFNSGYAHKTPAVRKLTLREFAQEVEKLTKQVEFDFG